MLEVLGVLGVFWNPQDLIVMMGTEIFKID